MNALSDENKYPVGAIVYAVVNPQRLLKIKRYYKRIYYCTLADDPGQRAHVYFQRELMSPEEEK